MARTLYLCYFPITDPLVETQVVAYLRGLAADGHEVHLLTWEIERHSEARRREIGAGLAAVGIHWHAQRYHKRPSLPATAYDMLSGIVVATRLARRFQIDVVHARNAVVGLVALAVRRLTGARMVFDMRGFMAEQYLDAGVWQEGDVAVRITRAAEQRCLDRADGIVVLSHRAKDIVVERGTDAGSVFVIPCCIDEQRFADLARVRDKARADLGLEGRRVLIYVGKLTGWYQEDEMMRFFAVAHAADKRWHFLILTQSHASEALAAAARAGVPRHAVDVATSSPEDVGYYLAAADAGISFIRLPRSGAATSPTKVGEYLAAGLPVVATTGIGDCDELLRRRDVGVLVGDDRGYERALTALDQLLQDPTTPERCRATAREELSLSEVGWPQYRALYRSLSRR